MNYEKISHWREINLCVKKKYQFQFSLICFVLSIVILLASTPFAYAHQPIIEKDASVKPANSVEELYAQAVAISDPTLASQVVYGRLASPTEIDLYTFTPARNESIPIEAMVPVNPANQNFRPAVFIVGEDVVSQNNVEFPLPLPEGYGARVIAPPAGGRAIFTEEFSIERLYHGTEEKLKVTASKPYYVAIYEPGHQVGSYALGLGTADNLSNASYPALLKPTMLKNVVETTLGLMGERLIPWMD